MESKQGQLTHLHNALDHLKESISLRKQENAPRQFRESVIKSLESCFDLMWKNLKNQLEEKYGIVAAEPRPILRESFAQGLLKKEEFDELENLFTDCNNPSRKYNDFEIKNQVFKDETMAETIAQRADLYHDVMRDVFNRMTKN